jgi:predicted transcriptional regulator
VRGKDALIAELRASQERSLKEVADLKKISRDAVQSKGTGSSSDNRISQRDDTVFTSSPRSGSISSASNSKNTSKNTASSTSPSAASRRGTGVVKGSSGSAAKSKQSRSLPKKP